MFRVRVCVCMWVCARRHGGEPTQGWVLCEIVLEANDVPVCNRDELHVLSSRSSEDKFQRDLSVSGILQRICYNPGHPGKAPNTTV